MPEEGDNLPCLDVSLVRQIETRRGRGGKLFVPFLCRRGGGLQCG